MSTNRSSALARRIAAASSPTRDSQPECGSPREAPMRRQRPEEVCSSHARSGRLRSAQIRPSCSDAHLVADVTRPAERGWEGPEVCQHVCVPTGTEAPIERGSVIRCDRQGVNRGNGSRYRASPGCRAGAALPRVRGSLDQADPRSARSFTGDDQGVLLRPPGAKARAVKARYVGVCRGCGAYTQPRNGKGDAYAYCEASHPGATERRWTREVVLAAMREWRDRYGRLPSYDWSSTHARRRGGQALEKLGSGDWPAPSVVTSVFGSWAAARDAATR
jgi:hypothetical protein